MLVECFGIVIAELAPQIGKAAGKGVEILWDKNKDSS